MDIIYTRCPWNSTLSSKLVDVGATSESVVGYVCTQPLDART